MPPQTCCAHSRHSRMAPWHAPLRLPRCGLFAPLATTHVARIRLRCTPWRRPSPSRCLQRFAEPQPWGAIAPWGKAKAAWRAECQALAPEMSSHETCGRVLAVCDPATPPPGLCRLDAGPRRPEAGPRGPRGANQPALTGQGRGPRTHARGACLSLRPGERAGAGQRRRQHPRAHRQARVDPPAPAGRRWGAQRGEGSLGETARQMQEQGTDSVRSWPAHPPGVLGDDAQGDVGHGRRSSPFFPVKS